MRIRILARDDDKLVRECSGPLPNGVCSVTGSAEGLMPCAGHDLMLKVGIGNPTSWLIRVAEDAQECPVYVLSGEGLARVS